MAEFEELAQRAAARVGTLLKEKWTIDKVLGIGGMATVYAGTHRNKKRVAIKMLHAELSFDPRVRERFLREGIAANTVGHRGAVEVFDEDVADDGIAFLVMELLDGETLESRRVRKGGTLPAAEVLSLVDQLLDVLAAAHHAGIVHRDLKPENLFYTSDKMLKVLDFGIASVREGAMQSGGGGTRVGSVMGTPAFMAPEQARARWDLVDKQTDLWAVGATMFTLLTGRLVREADTANEELALAITAPVPLLATVLDGVPPEVAALVDRALAYDKAQRWPDARGMQAALREAFHDGAATPDRRSLPEPLAEVSATAEPEAARASLPRVSVGDGPAAPAATTTPGSSTLRDAAGSRSIDGTSPDPKRSRLRAVLAAAGVVVVLGGIVVARLVGGSAPPPAPLAGPESGAEKGVTAAEAPPSVTALAARPPETAAAATPTVVTAPVVAAPEPPPSVTASAVVPVATAPTAKAGAARPPPPPQPVKPPDSAAKKTPPPPPAVKKIDPFSRRD